MGGVIVVNDGKAVRDILVPVYDALGLEWNPSTVGSVEDELGAPRDLEKVSDAFIDEFADRFPLEEGLFDDGTLALAEELAPDHVAP